MEKKGLISIIIILAILVVGLGGYIVYDKVFVETEHSAEKNENETSNKKENKKEETSNNVVESEPNTEVGNSSKVQTAKQKCTGTYYGASSATETYKYVLNEDGTFTADFGGVSGTTGVYVITDNTISLIGKKDVVGPREQDPYYHTEDYLIADDCSSITVTKGAATFGLNRQ